MSDATNNLPRITIGPWKPRGWVPDTNGRWFMVRESNPDNLMQLEISGLMRTDEHGAHPDDYPGCRFAPVIVGDADDARATAEPTTRSQPHRSRSRRPRADRITGRGTGRTTGGGVMGNMLDTWGENLTERRIIEEFWEWLLSRHSTDGVITHDVKDVDISKELDLFHGICRKRLEDERRELLESL